METSSLISPDTENSGYIFGSFRLEPDGTLWRGEVPVHLAPKELAALRLLLSCAGQVVAPSHLRRTLWGDVHVTGDSIPRCLSSLRARLGGDKYIQTVYKRGYRIMGAVQRFAAPALHDLPRLAIVPFACGYGVEAHLGNAISEETATRLTAIHRPIVSVVARDSVFALASKGISAQEIGETLKADLVLTGTIQAWTQQYRLRAEMVRVRDGTQIWVEDMLVARNRPSELGTELLEKVAFRLGGAIPAATEIYQHAIISDARAYELYLCAHTKWDSLHHHQMQDGAQLLKRAAAIDPKLVEARVDLIQAAIVQSLCGFLSPLAAAEQVRQELRAIPDPSITAPGVLLAMGWITFHVDRDLAAALRFYRGAAHLPHNPWTTRMRVLLALSRHRFEEAIKLLCAALDADPFAPWLHARLAWAYHLAGRACDSQQGMERCLELYPDHESTHAYGSLILAFNGQPDRALKLGRRLAEQSPYFDVAQSAQAYALALQGATKEARSILEQLEWTSRERFVLNSFTPAAYLALGDTERAITELRTSEASCCPWFFQMLADPRLTALHGHPEFERMRTFLRSLEDEAGDRTALSC